MLALPERLKFLLHSFQRGLSGDAAKDDVAANGVAAIAIIAVPAAYNFASGKESLDGLAGSVKDMHLRISLDAPKVPPMPGMTSMA